MEMRKFWFGKYKGELISTICGLDRSYVEWCLKNVKGFKLTEDEKIFYARPSVARCPYDDYDEGSVWDEFDREMTFDMMNDFD